jgi:hypothetical protein
VDLKSSPASAKPANIRRSPLGFGGCGDGNREGGEKRARVFIGAEGEAKLDLVERIHMTSP